MFPKDFFSKLGENLHFDHVVAQLNLPSTQIGKSSHYAKSVWCSSVMIAPRISGGIRCNMACAKLGASGSWKSWRTRGSQCTSLVKLAQEGQNGQTSQKRSTKLEKLVINIRKIRKLDNCQQNCVTTIHFFYVWTSL